MKLTLAVDLGDGPIEVATNLYVIVQYERKYKRKASEMATSIGYEDLLFLRMSPARCMASQCP
jgi:hypothetical protein